jgi:hypothetical protein
LQNFTFGLARGLYAPHACAEDNGKRVVVDAGGITVSLCLSFLFSSKRVFPLETQNFYLESTSISKVYLTEQV